MKQKIHYLFMLLLMLVAGVGGVMAEEYTLTISADDFNTTSYAANNNEKTSKATSTSGNTIDVKWTSNQVMKSSNVMQWQKNTGYIYNSTDLGTIKSVTVTSSEGTFTTYYGSSKQPSSNTVVGGGFFQIKVGSATGKSSKVNILFEIAESGVAVDPNVRFEKDNIEAYIGQSLTNALDKPNNLTVNYSSSNEIVAKVNNDGLVSCLGEGNTVISAAWDAVDGVYNSGVVTYDLSVKDPQKYKTLMFTPTEQADGNLENAPTGVTAVFNNTYNDREQITNGKEMTLTIKGIPSTYEVTGIFLHVRNNKSSGKGVAVATLGSSELGTMTIEGLGSEYSEQKMSITPSLATGDLVIKITCSENSVFCDKFYVEYKIPEGVVFIATPTFSIEEGTYFEAKSVELSCETEGAKIYYTTDGTEPTVESTVYTEAITISETTILKAIAIKGEDASAIASAEYKIVVTTGKGTVENPFTVADARNILSEGLTPTDVYVKGIVSGIVEAYNSKFGNISYNISDDGATESGQLQAYRGKGKNGADFTSDADIQVKDVVVLKGNLIDYDGTYELAAGNQLVSLVRPEKAEPNLTYANAAVSAVRGETFTAPVLTNPNNLTVVYSSSDKTVATVDSESGEVTLLKAGETTITASFAGNADYKEGSASYTLTVTVLSHTATFFVNGQQQGEPVTVAEDEAITFPTVAEELYGKKFVGWTTEAIDGEIKDKPATLVNAATMGTADVTYYAVYANMISGSSASLTKMTSTDTFETGDKVVIVADEENVAMYQETVNKTYVNKYTFVNDAATIASDDKNWFDVSAGSSVGTWKLGDETNGYVYTSSSNNLSIDTNNSTDFTLAWNSDKKKFTLVGNDRWLSYRSDLAADNQYFRMGGATTGNSSGDIYFDIYKFTSGSATYSDYCTTVVAPVKPAKPIIFHDDGGEYEGELTVAIAGEGTIKYTLNGDEQTYTAPFTINKTTTITAWTEQDGATSEVVEKTFTIKKTEKPAINLNGYYRIKGGDGNYVNVAGRKTVTFVDEAATATAAGTVIKVETENAQVKVLRSQGVDVPGYAEKAMRYVPKIVQLVAEKLGAVGEGNLLGKDGLGKIMDKFNESFDYHLYLEEAGENGYRIYGRTPSMKPVVDFYAENKADVDAKLPQLEQFINDAIKKVLAKTNGSGSSILVPFELETVWQNMDGTLTEPVDEASTARFYEEVLSSETNVWNFAYETAMIYWTKLKNHKKFEEYRDKLGDYAKYIDKVENIRPNFKYYIVQKGGEMDIISEGNGDIVANSANTIWTLEDRTEFSVAFNEENVLNNKYYTTLYTDFAYTLPEGEGVKAYKVTKVSEAGVAVKVEMKGIIPAQTPVLLESESKENQTLILSTEDGTAPTDNLLAGADKLIKEYQIKTAQVKALFDMAKEILGENTYNNYVKEYEHLMLRYAGTVNNKYFFGLSQNDMKGMKNVRMLNLNDAGENLGFYSNWVSLEANKALIIDSNDPVKLMLKGDVNRDGIVSIADVTALVNIILGKATYPADADKYDFDAAHVNADEDITIADVTALVNIILGKTQN